MKKNKIGIKILSAFFALIICLSFGGSITAKAAPLPKITTSTEEVIALRADVIVTKWRTYNGKTQYRRWNETRGYWVDPAWITL